jgi:hypothetical protein
VFSSLAARRAESTRHWSDSDERLEIAADLLRRAADSGDFADDHLSEVPGASSSDRDVLSVPGLRMESRRAKKGIAVNSPDDAGRAEALRTCHKCKSGQLEVMAGAEIGLSADRYFLFCPTCHWVKGIRFPKERPRFTA